MTTHPIQYQAPWFRALAAHPDLDLQVYFAHRASPAEQAAAGFGVEFDWDVNLLDGYAHHFLRNVAARPSIATFGGLDTPEIAGLIAERRFDALISCGWNRKSHWQAIRACWRTGTPVMVRSDSHLHTGRHALKRAVKEPVYRWFIARMSACLAVGAWSRDYFLHYGARPERVFLVPHVIDEARFRAAAARLVPERVRLRRRWHLPDHAVVFLMAAKFLPNKRPLDFLAALAKAAARGAPVHGLMVGDGPLRVECETFARRHHVPVTFAGFVNQTDMASGYIGADALVVPSAGETWGMVVNEAMTCGRPCLVSDRVGCGPDLVTADTGAIFPLGDVDRLADLLVAFASDPDRLRRCGEAAAERIKSYSVDTAVNGVLEAVRAVTH